jgi:hypothetical protein
MVITIRLTTIIIIAMPFTAMASASPFLITITHASGCTAYTVQDLPGIMTHWLTEKST